MDMSFRMLSLIQAFYNRTAAHLSPPLHSTLIDQFLDALLEVINISTCSLARNPNLCTQASVLGAAGSAYSNAWKRTNETGCIYCPDRGGVSPGLNHGDTDGGVQTSGNVICIGCISYHQDFFRCRRLGVGKTSEAMEAQDDTNRFP
jgi:hypothetical protein